MNPPLRPYPETCDSGAAWLGRVPTHWAVLPLGRIGRFFKGFGGTKADEVADGVPCVRYGDLYTSHKFAIRETRSLVALDRAADYMPIRYGDLLFAGSGETIDEIGKSAVNLIASRACCGGDVLVLRPTRALHAPFLGYASDHRLVADEKARMGRGVTVAHIYTNSLKWLTLPVPPLAEQRSIARFLDHSCHRIGRYLAAKERLIELLEEQKQAVIQRAVTRGLDPTVPRKRSGIEWLGDIPAHWEVKRLKLATGRPRNGIWGDDPDGEHDVVCVRVADFDRMRGVVKDRPTTLRSVDVRERTGRLLRRGDLLVEKSGGGDKQNVGCVVMFDHDIDAVCSNFVARLPFVENHTSRYTRYVHAALYARRLNYPSIKQTTGIQNLDLDAYLNLRWCFPPYPEQCAIADYLDRQTARLDRLVVQIKTSIERLREYRSALVTAVVTGKLDVRDAARRLPADPQDDGNDGIPD